MNSNIKSIRIDGEDYLDRQAPAPDDTDETDGTGNIPDGEPTGEPNETVATVTPSTNTSVVTTTAKTATTTAKIATSTVKTTTTVKPPASGNACKKKVMFPIKVNKLLRGNGRVLVNLNDLAPRII